MTYRMTVVLEYASENDAPPVGAHTCGKDLGEGRVCAVQFSDALRELEILEHHASDAVKRLASKAAFDYATPHSGRPDDSTAQHTGEPT